VFLIEKFHEFYAELLDVHARLESGELQPSGAHDRLVSLLNRQESEAQRESGHYGVETYLRAKYAMAALGDEILLRQDDGRWMGQLLEATLFRSQCAGEKVFDDIHEIQNAGSAAADLACVYLAVLSLGFLGAFRLLPQPEAQIAPYRQKLFRIAYGRDPVALTKQQPIAASAYAATLADGEGGQLPHIRPWVYALVLIVVLYVAGGVYLWRDSVSDLERLLEPINTSIASPGEAR
jgi:type VI secretion system protein ImpK